MQKGVLWEKQFVDMEDEITQVTLKCNRIQTRINRNRAIETQIDDMILYTL